MFSICGLRFLLAVQFLHVISMVYFLYDMSNPKVLLMNLSQKHFLSYRI